MKIRSKMLLVVALTLLFLLGALYVLLSRFLMDGFLQVEDDNARKDVSRALDAIHARTDAIESSLLTWSQWDDSYQFVQDKNPEFMKSNISTTLYTGMKINFFLYVTGDNTLLLDGGYDFFENKEIPVPEELKSLVTQKNHALWQNTDVNKTVKGIVAMPEHPLLIASAPITNTQASAPGKGFIVFARYLDPAEIQLLSAVTHLQLSLDHTQSVVGDIHIRPIDSENLLGVSELLDLQKVPVALISAKIPRTIYQQGVKTLRFLLVSVSAAGILFGFMIVILLERLVVCRLLRLDKEVQTTTSNLTFDSFVSVDGKDEITSLSNAVNGMIAAVSEIIHSIPESKEKM